MSNLKAALVTAAVIGMNSSARVCLAQQALMNNLAGAQLLGNQARESAAGGSLEAARVENEASFNKLILVRSEASSLTVPQAVSGIPRALAQETKKPRGAQGFKNGLINGAVWSELPAVRIAGGMFTRDSGLDNFFKTKRTWPFYAAAAVLAGLVLAPIALVLGLGRGAAGALFGAERKDYSI